MKRFISLLSPSFGAILVRLSQFLVLVAIGQVASGSLQSSLIASFGVVSSFAVLADSGAVNYVLSEAKGSITSGTFRRVLLVHAGAAFIGGAISVAYAALAFGDALGTWLWLVGALAAVQAIDSLTRVLRAPLLVDGRDHLFAGVDVAVAASKTLVIVGALWTQNLGALFFLPIASFVVFSVVAPSALRALTPGPPGHHTTRAVLSFGVAGAASALYSQAPLIVGGLLLPVEVVATISVAYRVAQPTELVPATLAQQATPRLARNSVRPSHLWVAFAGLGVVTAACLVVFAPLIERLIDVTLLPFAVYVAVVLSIPVKFGNYALAAGLYAAGLVHRKTLVTFAGGGVAVLASILAARTGDALLLVLVTLMVEVLLSVGFFLALVTRRHAG